MLCRTAMASQRQASVATAGHLRPSAAARASERARSKPGFASLWRRRLSGSGAGALRASPESHPIVPDAADDASSNAVAPTDAAAADAEAVERAAVADDAADAAAASASATAEVADEAQQAVVAVEQSADGVAQVAPPSLLKPSQWFASQGRVVQIGIGGVAAFAGITLLIAIVRTVNKYRSPRAKRKRTVNANKTVVEGIDAYLPNNRQELTPQVLRGLRMKTGFSGAELFRKYLWYALRERKFDPDTVADLIHLRQQLNLTDDEARRQQGQTADALKERAKRIYDKYGNVMLDVGGMTKAGIERKATCRALFSKLLYLAESEELAPSLDAATRRSLVQDVFGATDSDVDQLRIVSLYDVDLDAMDALATSADAPGASDQPGSPTTGDE